MKFQHPGQQLLHALQDEFNTVFPFLKIVFFKREETALRPLRAEPKTNAGNEISDADRSSAVELLHTRLGISGNMRVNEFEKAIEESLGVTALVFRKSGNLWMETNMTGHWTLGQQDEHGEEISRGFGEF